MRSRRTWLALSLLFLAACGARGGENIGSTEEAVIEAPRVCDRKIEELRAMMDSDSGAKCTRDIDCDCGSYCEMTGSIGKCELDCLTVDDPDYHCEPNTGQICDTWGKCSIPVTTPADDTFTFVQSVSPLVVTLPSAVPSGGFTPTFIEIELKTEAATQPAIATLPKVTLTGGTDADLGCIDDDSTTPCAPGNHPVVDVSCSPPNFGPQCDVPDSAWTLDHTAPGAAETPGKTKYFFTTRVQARPRSNVSLLTAPWSVFVRADRGVSNGDAQISFVTPKLQPVAGHYVGELVLVENPWRPNSATEGTQVRVPVEAFVTGLNAPIFVSDPARLISPTGGIRVGALSWPSGGPSPSINPPVMQLFNSVDTGTGAVRAAITTDAITLGAQTGQLLVDVSVNLNNVSSWKWRFELHRTDGLTRQCISNSGCRTDEVCDSEVKLCVPNAAWTPTLSATYDISPLGLEPIQPNSGWRAYAKLAIDAAIQLFPQRTGDDIERLMCATHVGTDWSTDYLGDQIDPVSGDLECATGGVPYTGRAIAQHEKALNQMLPICLNELNADPPANAAAVDFGDSVKTACIAKPRFLAAMATPGALNRFNQPRSGRLFIHLMDQWMRTHAFVAKQAIEFWMHDAVTTSPLNIPIDQYMTAVRNGWALVLDPEIRRAVLAAARFDGKPDYRREMFPALRWVGQSMTDSIRGIALQQKYLFPVGTGGTIGYGQATLGPDTVNLSGSVSMMFSVGWDKLIPGLRILFEGGGLSVRMSTRGRLAYDIDTRIQSTQTALYTDDTWSGCWQRCVQDGHTTGSYPGCGAWDYDSATKACRTFATGATYRRESVPHTATGVKMSGFVKRASIPDWLSTTIYARTLTTNDNVSIVVGQPCNSNDPTTCQAECQRWCQWYGAPTCTHSTYEHNNNKTCTLRNELPVWLNASEGNYTFVQVPQAQLLAGLSEFSSQGNDTGTTTVVALSNINTWSDCYDKCTGNTSCHGWSFKRSLKTCRLATTEGSGTTMSSSMAGSAPETVLTVSHTGKDGTTVSHDIVLEHGRWFLDPSSKLSIVRDALMKSYHVYRLDATSNTWVPIGSWNYTDAQAPVAAAGNLRIDRDPNGGADVLSDLAVWTTALDGDRLNKLAASPLSGGPNPSLLDEPDQVLGMPVRMLEGLATYLDLAAEVGRQKLSTVLASCELGRITPAQKAALDTIGEAVRISLAVEDLAAASYQQTQLITCWDDAACTPFGGKCNRAGKPTEAERQVFGTCVQMDGVAALKVNPPWEEAYRNAGAQVEASRAEALRYVRALVTCENPLGISDNDLPLYFDPEVESYFASSDHMIGLATNAITDATTALTAAQANWSALVTAELNQHIDDLNARETAVSKSYDGELSRLCGDLGENMLSKLADHTYQPESCFIDLSKPECNNKSIQEAPATCYRGELGEALLGMKATQATLATRKQTVNDLSRQVEDQSYLCALVTDEQKMLEQHYKQMGFLHMGNAVLGILSNVLEFSSLGSAASAAALLAHRNQSFGGNMDELREYENLSSSSASDHVASGAISLLSSTFGSFLGQEEAQFSQRLAMHQENIKLVSCNNDLEKAHAALRTSQGAFLEETALFEGSALRLGNGVRTVESIMRRGAASVARERASRFVRPEHHMWLDSLVEAYKKSLKRAIRLSYLAMRAAEYEQQMSFGVRGLILSARTPADLTTALNKLNDTQNQGKLCGVAPVPKFFVVKLSALLGIADPEVNLTPAQKEIFRAELGARRNWFVDEDGKVLGNAIRFVLTPSVGDTFVDPGLSNTLHFRAGERIKSIAMVALGTGISQPHNVRLYHANTFASQWCVASQHPVPFQVASIRPQKNLLSDATGGQLDDEQTPYTEADISALNDKPAGFDTSLSWSAGEADKSLRGRGLYGEYWILIPAGSGLNINKLDEIYIRFDYESAAKQQ
jgi:hypothetical protein